MSSARKGRASPPARGTRARQPEPRKLRVLFLASQFPFPANSGATIKSLSIIDYLRRRHDVRLVSLTREPLTREQEKWARSLGVVRTVQHEQGRSPVALFQSYLARVPLSVQRNRNAEMRALVEAERADFSPDVILADGWLVAQYVPADFQGLALLHEHNAEFELWERQAELEGFPRRWLVRREAARVKRYEGALVKRFDTTLAVSVDDRKALGRIGGDMNRIKVLPNVPETALLDFPQPRFEDTEPVVLFFGTLSWQPNIEGLERYAGFIHKQVMKAVPEARLLVAGRGASPELVRRLQAAPGVEYLGEVEDVEGLHNRARVAVDTSRSGGGTRLKLLNALARGIPVVASTEAARGLDIVPGEHMVVARNEHALVEGVVSLLRDEARWRVLSENGRALIRARYVPEAAFGALDEAMARAARLRR